MYQVVNSFIFICSSMSSPSGSYYTSLLSQDYQEELGDEDNVEFEHEGIKSSPMTGMTLDFKIKGSSKNFSEDKDNLLVSALLNIGLDLVDGNQQKNGII
jgi:hypothetical protein